MKMAKTGPVIAGKFLTGKQISLNLLWLCWSNSLRKEHLMLAFLEKFQDFTESIKS